jgi:signal transduction histidine kinase
MSVWQLYGWYIIGTCIVVSVQLFLIGGLLTQRSRLRQADATIRAREASLRCSLERTRQMTGRLINAQEAARAEIARDLHDDVSQKLAYIAIGVNNLKRATGELPDPELQKAFADLERETSKAFEGLRRMSHELHPAKLQLLGLVPTLRSHCSEIVQRQNVEVDFTSTGDIGSVDPAVAVGFFRIAQESLRNGIVHGGATHLAVTLDRIGDELELVVSDDGQGFDVGAARQDSGGLGLVTMEERANLIGGVVAVTSDVGRGTTVRMRGPATLPVAGPPPISVLSETGTRVDFRARPAPHGIADFIP